MNGARVGNALALSLLCWEWLRLLPRSPRKVPKALANPQPRFLRTSRANGRALQTTLAGVARCWSFRSRARPRRARLPAHTADSFALKEGLLGLCFRADHLPAEGTYDGQRLVIKVKGSQNSPTCNDYTLTFVRGKDHYFERKIENGSSYLDPVK